ncbi:MAG: hypothetical protein H0W62_04540 [Chitinophagales bacterium]|nr:hypothetical protein [Chitinophagales bacterium]
MINFEIDTSSFPLVEASFDRIATELMNHCQLTLNDRGYRFLDLEFYYHCPLHPDTFSNKHQEVAGKLRAHDYGVDISLGADNECFGGVLLKGLIRSDSKVFSKPQILKELFNCLHVGTNIIELKQITDSNEIRYFKTIREFTGTPGTEDRKSFSTKKYRYIANSKEYFKSVKRKEYTIKHSNLSLEEQRALLGYSLRLE